MVCEQWRIYPLAKSAMAPPLAKKFFFDIVKKLENLVWPPLCVSTSGQRTFGPPLFEILNTPLYVRPVKDIFLDCSMSDPDFGVQ